MEIKTCGETTCEFYSAITISEDNEDRSMSRKKLATVIIICLNQNVACFAISMFALYASGWKPTPRRTFGYFRIEILLNLVSIQIIWLLTGILVYEAIKRLGHQNKEIKGPLMFGVACFGVIVNLVMVFVLGTISTTWKLLNILMETAPKDFDCTRLVEGLCDMDEVIAVHELHVWAITVGKVCLTCHVRLKHEANTDAMLDKIIEHIKREHKISHVTVQVEREQNP
ncbi:hypothetical protein ARALYDRAFT_891053 [Arabidopsis lyrata subsp. lyrata]|uniref:Cation efflux family protein n=1 Tax=Arabidopsis lyrata subsp. lyrata TaxID=81972 RepID=D7KK71_ARALL|nr:hypothetical protein ARALYDRAFT_891053 [Arabidopsis lyrata subsp. lyrata]